MELKYSIKRTALVVGILALVCITAVAQEDRSEISIQGTGLLTKPEATVSRKSRRFDIADLR
jgi:hypothetical protein